MELYLLSVCGITLKGTQGSFPLKNSLIKKCQSQLVIRCEAIGINDENLCFTFRFQRVCAAPLYFLVKCLKSLTSS